MIETNRPTTEEVNVNAMKDKMNRMFAGMAVVLSVLFVQGCASPGAGRATIRPEPLPPGERGTAGTRSDRLNVALETVGNDEAAKIAAKEIAEETQRSLIQNGFRMDRSAPDISVATQVETDMFDQSGNYYVFDGRAKTRIERVYDSSLIGEETVSARGERKLGKEEAARAVGSKLASDTAAWIGKAASPSVTGLTSAELTVYRAWGLGSDAQYSKDLIDRATSIKGVVSCRQVSHDYKARKMVFRVVYVEDLFPEGVLNRLINDPNLNLKAGK